VDHPALAAAARCGRPIVPLYIHHDAGRPAGAASRWWLHGSLQALGNALQLQGYQLVLRRGEPASVLAAVASECGARALHFNRGTDPDALTTEARVVTMLGTALDIRRFACDALHAPGAIVTAGGAAYRVFTPFWHACLAGPAPAAPLPAPPRCVTPRVHITSERLDDWRLVPSRPHWVDELQQNWQPGERGARAAFQAFLAGGLAGYRAARDRPDLRGTSRLSPHLHFGELSPREVWHETRARAAVDGHMQTDAAAFLRELGWREFSLHLLAAWPDLATQPFRRKFTRFPWRDDPVALRAWQKGLTGYPLVDAGMRELRATGWMHNRVRMTAASFLVKHLLVHWREGEAWFWDALLDADAANNAVNWQWVAGCGTDAAPWFRIFNPVRQGEKFDPAGDYVKRWLPELARIPARFVHAPWRAPAAVLSAAGVQFDRDYPYPLVRHEEARARALAAYALL
jgi:deoxyribodipyrimidine photo-lyase